MFIIQFFFYMLIAIVLFVLVMAVLLVARFWSMIRLFFGAARQDRDTDRGPTLTGEPRPRNTTFDKDEGEYADFEEIK